MLKNHIHHVAVSLSLILILAIAFGVYYVNPKNILINNVKAEGTYTNIGTSDASDASNDGLNYSQGNVLHIDNFGKYLMLTQERTGPTTHWTWSNNAGTTWTQGAESYSFLTRGAVAYDKKNDILHVIWAATDSNDGIIYRRYSISRDGSNNITSIQRVDSGTVNLQMDTSSSRTLSQPTATWYDDGSTNGILVATWSKYGGGIFEVRATMRNLSNTAADGVGGNWKALDGVADTFGTDAPLITADKVASSTSTTISSVLIRGGAGASAKSIYVFTYEATTVKAHRAIWNQTSHDWSTGWQGGITVGSANPNSGYSLKYELITKPVYDAAHDRIYIAWPTWRDNTLGDTVTLAYLDAANAPSTNFDVYSAMGTHNYAPTVDISYDSGQGRIYVAYIESTTFGSDGHIYYKIFDGTALSAATAYFTLDQADIPVMFPESVSSRLLMVFRRNGALPPTSMDPHSIYFGYIPLTLPNIQFSALTSNDFESTTTVNIPVFISDSSSLDISINYTISGGSASGSGIDYTLASGILTIPAGSMNNNIVATIINDTDDEPNETIEITLSAPVNATLGVQTTHSYTINDDDLAPTDTATPTATTTTSPTSSTTGTATASPTTTATTATTTATSSATSTISPTSTSVATVSPTATLTSEPTPSSFSIKFITEANKVFNFNSDGEIIGETSITNAKIKAKILETGDEFNIRSDENGKFSFKIPNTFEPGKYTLTAEVKKDAETAKSTITFEVATSANWAWLWVALIGIALLIIAIFVYRRRKNKAKNYRIGF